MRVVLWLFFLSSLDFFSFTFSSLFVVAEESWISCEDDDDDDGMQKVGKVEMFDCIFMAITKDSQGSGWWWQSRQRRSEWDVWGASRQLAWNTHEKNERRAHTGDQWEAQKRIESYYQLLSYLFLCFYIFHCSSSTKIAQFCEWMAWVHKRRYNLNHLPQKRSSLSSLFCLIPSILTTQKDLTHFTGSFWKLQFPFSIALQSTGSKNILSCSSNLIDFYPIFPFAIGWCVLFFLWF